MTRPPWPSRGEASEVAAAMEIAALCGDASAASAAEVVRVASRLVALLTPSSATPWPSGRSTGSTGA